MHRRCLTSPALQKEGLEQLLIAKQLMPDAATRPLPSQVKEVEKRSLAVIAQCMEIMSLGGPQLDALLRTLADRFAVAKQVSIKQQKAGLHDIALTNDIIQKSRHNFNSWL